MKKSSTMLLIALLLLPMVLMAGGEATQSEEANLRKAEYQAMLEEAERARQEAEAAHLGAAKAAELAREAARMGAEMARETARMEAQAVRENSERSRQESEQLRRERALKNEEMTRTREELSKAHRELREATREVARAHRSLTRADNVHRVVHHVNLGDRAVIGVVLGEETDRGVKIIGVSPDGPAERAGLEQGDTLVSLRGVELAGGHQDGHARESVFQIMSETADGEELAAVVERDGETWEYTVTAEQREPRSWQSVIRIPEIEAVAEVPGTSRIIVERIEIPEIDEEAIAAQVEQLAERIEATKYVHFSTKGDHAGPHDFEFNLEEFSEFGEHAMREANVWYGLPQAHGLELTSVNEGLGAYFKTDRGVLVINAREDNAYQLESGDVILSIGSTSVDSPADMMRALRDVDPGSELDIQIKRNGRDEALRVVVPENRLGYR